MQAKKDFQADEPNADRGQEMTTVQEAGRRGGLSTLAKHGTSHFRRAGAIGGRTTATRHQKKAKQRGSKDCSSKDPAVRIATPDMQHGWAAKDCRVKQPATILESQADGSTQKRTAHREAGRKGGLSTLNRYGRAHMSLIGRLGGRPTFEKAVADARLVRGGELRRGSRKKEVWGHRLEPRRCSCRALLLNRHGHCHDPVELSPTCVAHFNQVSTEGTKSE